MPFDAKRFKKTKFQRRVGSVPVPDLKDFFPDGEEPIWKVRGLTGVEIGQTKEAAAKNKNLSAVVEALSSLAHTEKVKGIKDALGIGKIPDNIAERISQLELGSVDPKCDTDLAVLLCERFPVEFYNITTKILALTGQGMEPGKPVASTQTPESEAV